MVYMQENTSISCTILNERIEFKIYQFPNIASHVNFTSPVLRNLDGVTLKKGSENHVFKGGEIQSHF